MLGRNSTLIQRRSGILRRRTACDNLRATSRKVGTLRIFVAGFPLIVRFQGLANGQRLAFGRL
jgi:hypothetical protein